MAHSYALVAEPGGARNVQKSPLGVWTDAPASMFAEVPPWLVLDEQIHRRISKFHNPQDRRSAITARALTVLATAEMLDVLPNEVILRQKCPQCHGDDHGPPSLHGLAEFHISWAHTRERVVVAASPLPVAVDTEQRVETASILTKRTLATEEQAWFDREHDPDAFTRIWCRKECAVKMGWIDLDRLTEISFCAEGSLLDSVGGAHVVERSVEGSAVVALTSAKLRWVSAERLKTRVDTSESGGSQSVM